MQPALPRRSSPPLRGRTRVRHWATGKIAPDTLQHALRATSWGGPHHVSPALLSLSQATEAGTIYRPDEIRALADIAHAHGMSVHVDGARIANALARLN